MSAIIAFIDTEVSLRDNRIQDYGLYRSDGVHYHGSSVREFHSYLTGVSYLCGHNILHHDRKYLALALPDGAAFLWIDTLPLSPLLYPQKPYHHLVKDDKLISEDENNPLADAEKARELLLDEISAFVTLPADMRQILYDLLSEEEDFSAFFHFLKSQNPDLRLQKSASQTKTLSLIRTTFSGRVCENADLASLVGAHHVALSYCLSLINVNDAQSMLPAWVQMNHPDTSYVMKALRGTPCGEGCTYCAARLDSRRALNRLFGYEEYRLIGGEPLQQRAVDAAIRGASLLAVFPTGGGKSITFQVPALLSGENERGLTVVISPLQSLMKDQVDNLAGAGITRAVTINGLLNPVERADAIRRVEEGDASLLYISPELLRSNSMERLLKKRHITRFVIDEAHCFSAWGQDFRVDYLYIGPFIRNYQEATGRTDSIPVSCFTATAKQKVISDICDYFKHTLNLNLLLYTSSATRENLRYRVLHQENEDDKYRVLRELIERKACPTIVYVSRVKRTYEIAKRLSHDGIEARPFNGQMGASEKIANQEAFLRNEVDVIVATSAFGMGVDKKDIRLVVHYDISDSLENYVQEAGRAGRDPALQAECYVLYHDNDLDKHFVLLNQTKLSISEIQQVWVAIKHLTGHRGHITCSALEIAREAGWDSAIIGIETRVKTAVAALENAGYVIRGNNAPRVYATSIQADNMEEASARIMHSLAIPEAHKQNAIRIMSSLISARSLEDAGNAEAESRVDYLADILGLEKAQVIDAVSEMREDGLLSDNTDMTALISPSDSLKKALKILDRFFLLTTFVLSKITEEAIVYFLKEWNNQAEEEGLASSVRDLRTVLYLLAIKDEIEKMDDVGANRTQIRAKKPMKELREKCFLRTGMARYALENLFQKAEVLRAENNAGDLSVPFSVVGLYKGFIDVPQMDFGGAAPERRDMEDALLYLSKIGALRIEGGFLVLYNGMQITRLLTDNRLRYKVEDYRTLNAFYRQRMQQIHIVGEYANLMVRDYEAALQYVNDYFQMDYKAFIARYFKGDKAKEINRNITAKRYQELYGGLSEIQLEIINDDRSKYIAVLAGPGSGKTRVLVHKMAALLQLDEVKAEQLLMLTFSRAAAVEFKERLTDLIGNAAYYVEVKTFHSYCYDLIGKQADPETLGDVVANAVQIMEEGAVERLKLMKSVLVIDEAQDMSENEYRLVQALMNINEDMRVIAVGDDDQNIYAFRGSDASYFRAFAVNDGTRRYEMNDNYRSGGRIIALSNLFAATIANRLKTTPIVPVRKESGEVRLIKYTSDHLEEALVSRIVDSRRDGTVCVLTRTNNEAACVLALFQRAGVHATLTESTETFRLYNLVEIRFFLKQIQKQEQKVTMIYPETWKRALDALETRYRDSTCLPVVERMLAQFVSFHRNLYLGDLMEFIFESSYEDFVQHEEGDAVIVSTMHKAKGREFDHVCLLLNHYRADDDEARRLLYVAMTRAKRVLEIHCNTGLFDFVSGAGVDVSADNTAYGPPGTLLLPLTMRDVNLGWFQFKDRNRTIFRLHSGQRLNHRGGQLFAALDGAEIQVCAFSKQQSEALGNYMCNGYVVHEARVNYIVAWHDKNDPPESKREYPVLLPVLELRK